ncbi:MULTISPECIES: hypothetical protein [Bacillaceae]|uniref:hypothetical protein n=1 Tax=Bacillaceae TaxID=186817 RepID=UPI000BFB738B|nr:MULTISPECIES: hypothetical protein [Bacillaceae]PGT88985.1 hypothetical protein COD11_04735 [Bacillus sp. AFS040349]UGB30607.1 hypothetical protein LPC09_23405 [Metabacillus sp. B2-18]
MEMFSKDHRFFSNKLPNWAVGAHVTLILFLLLLGLGITYLAFTVALGSSLGSFLLLLFAALIILFLALFGYKNLRKYLDYAIKVELRDDGYYYSFHNKKTRKTEEILLPYQKIDYVLIGKSYILLPKNEQTLDGIKPRLKKVAQAKLYIKGSSTLEKEEVLTFKIGHNEMFDEWVRVFRENQVPLYHTELSLNKTPNTSEAIAGIPKQEYEGTLSFTIGDIISDFAKDDVYLTEEIKMRLEKSRKRRHSYSVFIALVQIPMVSLWFPHFPIEDGFFSSIDMLPWLLTLIALFIVNAGNRKWYKPLLDGFLVVLAINIGTLLSTNQTEEFSEAVLSYNLMVTIFFLAGSYLYMFSRWLWGKFR